MSKDQGQDGDEAARDEIADLLKDPQVRAFLDLYLSIPHADARAHVRHLAAELSLPVRRRDLERQKRLGLSPRGARRGARPRPA